MPEDRQPAASIRRTRRRATDTTQIPRILLSTTLAPQLQKTVPYCAQLCLATYVNQEYNCPYNDFTCLCRQYSSQGLTLGELAYICLEQDCGHTNLEETKSVYSICAAKSGAVFPTHHHALTVPATTASAFASSSTILDTDTTTMEPRTQTQQHRPTTSPISTPSYVASTAATNVATSAVSDPSQTYSPSSSSTLAAQATASSLRTTRLTGAQAAGISIAAMGAVILAIAAVWFIACFRRRKVTIKDERKSYDFVDEAPPRFSPFNYGYADPRGPLGGFHDRRVEIMTEKRNSNWYRSHFGGANVQRYEKSVEICPQSQRSNESMRTLSQLLPDKPDPTLARAPPRSPAPSAATATTVFEEDRVPPIPPLKPLPRLPRASRTVQFPPPIKPRNPQYAEQFTFSPEETRQPSLSLKIPRQAARLDRIPSPISFPLPPNAQFSRDEQRASNGSRAETRDSAGSVLNYYASPEAGYDTSPELDATTPIEVEVPKRKPVPSAITVTKPTRIHPALRMNSNGSDTSFESNELDEPTPPEELAKQLTSVKLPAVPESPIAGIRYPKVPRSSNQSVPRSPGPKYSPVQPKHPLRTPKEDRVVLPTQPEREGEQRWSPVTPKRQGTASSSLSGSTLAAKRLGSSAAQDLERRLHLADSTHSRTTSHATMQTQKSEPNSGKSMARRNERQESPLKGYGRVASGGRRISHGKLVPEMKSPGPHLWRSPGFPGQPQEVSLKSPLWEPKLTPSRRGDDLYLSVGVASPRTAGFTPMANSFPR